MMGEVPLYSATVSRGVTPKHGGEGSAERGIFPDPSPWAACILLLSR